jgi:dCMP deaminase
MSKDPSTRVGSVIVNQDRLVLATGFNGFPRGIADDDRLHVRETKLELVVHAEMNAVLSAAHLGISVKGGIIYTACHSAGHVWGGPPCIRCAVECIQAGIQEVVSLPAKTVPSRWTADLEIARQLMKEAGMAYRELPLEALGD